MDLLRYLCGDVVKVYCQQGPSTRGFDVEETGALVLTFKSGAVGTFVFSDAVASPHNWEGASTWIPFLLSFFFPRANNRVEWTFAKQKWQRTGYLGPNSASKEVLPGFPEKVYA